MALDQASADYVAFLAQSNPSRDFANPVAQDIAAAVRSGTLPNQSSGGSSGGGIASLGGGEGVPNLRLDMPSGTTLDEFAPQTALTAEQVRQTYLDLLDRTPSAQGLEYWTGVDLDPNIDYELRPTTITSVEDLRKAIMEGPEYQAKQAGDITTKLVQEAYREQLGRDPTIADFEYWTGIDFDPQITASEAPTTLNEIEQIRQAISQSPEFQQRVELGLEQPFQPAGQPGQMVPFSYTDFPGGIYGPGEAMPNIFQPAGQQPAQTTPAPGTAAPGPRTMVSPGITTYAYPQPFGNVDIFSRPGAQAPTPMAPAAGTVPAQSPTNTTTQQDMGGSMAGGLDINNLSPAQRALLGNIFGNI